MSVLIHFTYHPRLVDKSVLVENNQLPYTSFEQRFNVFQLMHSCKSPTFPLCRLGRSGSWNIVLTTQSPIVLMLLALMSLQTNTHPVEFSMGWEMIHRNHIHDWVLGNFSLNARNYLICISKYVF